MVKLQMGQKWSNESTTVELVDSRLEQPQPPYYSPISLKIEVVDGKDEFESEEISVNELLQNFEKD